MVLIISYKLIIRILRSDKMNKKELVNKYRELYDSADWENIIFIENKMIEIAGRLKEKWRKEEYQMAFDMLTRAEQGEYLEEMQRQEEAMRESDERIKARERANQKVEEVKTREGKRHVEYLRQNDYEKIVRELDIRKKMVMKNLVVIGTKVGLRISDLLKLRFEMIDQEGNVRVSELKTGKKRNIRLNNVALSSLEELRAFYGDLGYKDGGYLFKSQNRAYVKRLEDKAVTDRAVNKMLREMEDYFNIPYPLGTHSLRKKFGRDVYQATGKDIGLVMKVLNHSSQAVTLAYIGIEKEQIEDVYNLI